MLKIATLSTKIGLTLTHAKKCCDHLSIILFKPGSEVNSSLPKFFNLPNEFRTLGFAHCLGLTDDDNKKKEHQQQQNPSIELAGVTTFKVPTSPLRFRLNQCSILLSKISNTAYC